MTKLGWEDVRHEVYELFKRKKTHDQICDTMRKRGFDRREDFYIKRKKSMHLHVRRTALLDLEQRMSELHMSDLHQFLDHETGQNANVEDLLSDLATEFRSNRHSVDAVYSYYDKLAVLMDRIQRTDPQQPLDRETVVDIMTMAFWDIMGNRQSVLPVLYKCLKAMQIYPDCDLMAECTEFNETCSHSERCKSVLQAMLLHAKNRDIQHFWDLFLVGEQNTGPLDLILRCWIGGYLPDPEDCLRSCFPTVDNAHVINDSKAILTRILEVIPDEPPQTKAKAVEIFYLWQCEKLEPSLSNCCSYLYLLNNVDEPLNWQLAEILLDYGPDRDSQRCVAYLANIFGVEGGTLPSSAEIEEYVQQRVSAFWPGPGGLPGHDQHRLSRYIVHVITKAWLDMACKAQSGFTWRDIGPIMEVRDRVGEMPPLTFAVFSSW